MTILAATHRSTTRAEQFVRAAAAGNITVVQRLLEQQSALVEARARTGETALLAAIYNGAFDVAELLVENGARLDIFAAAALGKETVVHALLRREPPLRDSTTHDGWKPLHLAAFFGHPIVMAVLLAAGADLNATSANDAGYSPLHAAISGAQQRCVEFLLGAGAEVNRPAANGWTPLHLSAFEGLAPIAELLLESGAAVNVCGADGATPLMTALIAGAGAVECLLRRYGARLWG